MSYVNSIIATNYRRREIIVQKITGFDLQLHKTKQNKKKKKRKKRRGKNERKRQRSIVFLSTIFYFLPYLPFLFSRSFLLWKTSRSQTRIARWGKQIWPNDSLWAIKAPIYTATARGQAKRDNESRRRKAYPDPVRLIIPLHGLLVRFAYLDIPCCAPSTSYRDPSGSSRFFVERYAKSRTLHRSINHPDRAPCILCLWFLRNNSSFRFFPLLRLHFVCPAFSRDKESQRLGWFSWKM